MDRRGKYHIKITLALRASCCICFFLAATITAYAQISRGGRPLSLSTRAIREIPVVSMPVFDIEQYKREKETEYNSSRLKSLVFAKPFSLDIAPDKDGAWENLADGSRVWRIALQSPGAGSLNIIFSTFRLRPGVSVFLYNPRQTHVLGAFDHRNNQVSGSLAISPVRGDSIIVEMQVEVGLDHFGELVIGNLNHDFIGILDQKAVYFGSSGRCNIDINCPVGDEWQTQKYGIARIMVNGTTFCTGVLVNNTANDGKPYFLTANHCIPDNAAASNTVFIFRYESPFCNGGAGSLDNTLSGSGLLATQGNLDFSLVELSGIPPASFRPWYAGWNRVAEAPLSTVAIHHPSRDVKKIALDTDPPVTSTFGSGYTAGGHWRIAQWDIGTTEPGSSGSPLFDQGGYIRGMLTGGSAKCGDSVNDYFCKFSLAWEMYEGAASQLKPWLDPGNTGAETLHGLNPYAGNEMTADFTVSTTEICAGSKVVFTDFSTGEIDSWSWDFGEGATPASALTRGPHLVEYPTGGSRTVSLEVGGGNESDIKTMQFNLEVKATNLPRAGFGYTEEEFSVRFIDMSENANMWYWEFGDAGTSTFREPVNTYSTNPNQEYTVRQLVRNRACSDTAMQMILVTLTEPGPEPLNRELKVYPVPASSFINIGSSLPFTAGTVVELLSVSGQVLLRIRAGEGASHVSVPVDTLPAGTYILKIVAGDGQATFKIPVLR
jgi:lysyl endopeptidase